MRKLPLIVVLVSQGGLFLGSAPDSLCNLRKHYDYLCQAGRFLYQAPAAEFGSMFFKFQKINTIQTFIETRFYVKTAYG